MRLFGLANLGRADMVDWQYLAGVRVGSTFGKFGFILAGLENNGASSFISSALQDHSVSEEAEDWRPFSELPCWHAQLDFRNTSELPC